MIRAEPEVKQETPRHEISSVLARRIVQTRSEFSAQETRSSLRPDRQSPARLYLREVIPLIHKTPKQSFLPPCFPGAIPFKRTQSFILGSHAHMGPEAK